MSSGVVPHRRPCLCVLIPSKDPAGRLRALPHGARLPPPPSLTEEDLARARALSPAYPRGPSPPPPPPQTEDEYMRGVEERANEYHAF